MNAPGFHVVPAALRGYALRSPGLADEISSVATSGLAAMTGLPAESFSDVGAEVGLPAAFQRAVQSQLDGLAAAAEALRGLGGAVDRALGSYQQQEDNHAAGMTRAGQV